jgi:Putative MetA-pathway of phenol degradation
MHANVRTLWRAGMLVVAYVCCPTAFALSPPLVTDDPETPGAGGWEINITSSIDSARDDTFIEAPLFDINYGFVENDQFKVEFAVASIDASDDQNRWGIGDLLIGYKYRFLEEDDPLGWQVSIYPQVSSPTGNDGTGIGAGVTELQIPFQFGKNFCNDKLYVNPEVGYNVVFEDDDLNNWKYGLAAEWSVNERLEVMGEVGGFVFPQPAEPDDTFFNFGFEYILNEQVALLGSAGRSFRSRDAGTPDFTALLGFEITIGGNPEAEDKGSERPGPESGESARSYRSGMARLSSGQIFRRDR